MALTAERVEVGPAALGLAEPQIMDDTTDKQEGFTGLQRELINPLNEDDKRVFAAPVRSEKAKEVLVDRKLIKSTPRAEIDASNLTGDEIKAVLNPNIPVPRPRAGTSEAETQRPHSLGGVISKIIPLVGHKKPA